MKTVEILPWGISPYIDWLMRGCFRAEGRASLAGRA